MEDIGVVDHTQRAHSRYSPSGAHRWMNCPASFHYPEPERQTSFFAEEGTAAHELAEAALNGSGNCDDFLGQEFNGFVVDEDMADFTQKYVDNVREIPGVHNYEERLEHPRVEDMFGTADAVIIQETKHDARLVIRDLKYGKGVEVAAEGNPQLRIYALMALHRYNFFGEITTVDMGIVQPRLYNYSTEEMEVSDLLEWEETKLLPAIERLDAQADEHNAGSWCKFCPKAAVCPELAAKNLAVAELIFEDAPPVPAEIKEPVLPSPETLTNEQVSQILGLKKQVEGWLTAVEGYALRAVLDGEEVPGFKPVAKRGRREWDDPDKVKELVDTMKLDGYTAPKLKSVAQLEKVVGKKSFKALFESYVGFIEGDPTLAPEADKRPALELTDPEDYFIK